MSDKKEKSFMRASLEAVKPYTSGRPIEEVQRELGLKRVIKLASNENPLGPSPKALEAIRLNLSNLNRYPDSSSFFLVRKLAERYGAPSEEFIVGNGSDEIITLAVRAFVEPQDEVIIAHPTFLIYQIAAHIAEAAVRIIPLKGFRYDLPAMRQAVTEKTKLIFIANPDNPTGTYVTKTEVEAFMKDMPPHVILFFDEAYAEMVDAPDYPETIFYSFHRPVITTRTFSKAYGLSGIRIGYGRGRADLIAALHRVREPFNVNSLAQAAAVAALEDAAHVKAMRQLLTDEKPFLYRGLDELGLTAVPSAVNFILFHAGTQAPQIVEALLKKGIIVRGMSGWSLPEYIRVTVGLHEENAAFIETLREVIKGLRG